MSNVNEPTSCPECASENISCKENMDGLITEGYSCVCNDCGVEWNTDNEVTVTITKSSTKPVSEMPKNAKFITYVKALNRDAKELIQLKNEQGNNEEMFRYIGKIDAYDEVLSIFKKIEKGEM